MSLKLITENRTPPICVLCNIKPVKKGGLTKNGFQKFQKHCSSCSRLVYTAKSLIYRTHKKTFCESCGFIPEHKCQLDVDHIDGNHKNDDISNLQTLCANCHRLKTHKQRQEIKIVSI